MNSRKILEDYLEHIKLSASRKKELIDHTENVVKICKEFADKLEGESVDIKRKILIASAYLHDIAKYNKEGKIRNNHNKKAYDVLHKKKYRNNVKHLENVCRVIKVHKGKFDPKGKIYLEAAILRIADKLDKFRKGKKNAKTKCEDSLRVIKKHFDKCGEDFDDFKKIYNTIYEEYHRQFTREVD